VKRGVGEKVIANDKVAAFFFLPSVSVFLLAACGRCIRDGHNCWRLYHLTPFSTRFIRSKLQVGDNKLIIPYSSPILSFFFSSSIPFSIVDETLPVSIYSSDYQQISSD
jgi:hypothetical protein